MEFVSGGKYFIESDGYRIAKCSKKYVAHAPRIHKDTPNLLLVSGDLDDCKLACEKHLSEKRINNEKK